jgi:hypothetical protein
MPYVFEVEQLQRIQECASVSAQAQGKPDAIHHGFRLRVNHESNDWSYRDSMLVWPEEARFPLQLSSACANKCLVMLQRVLGHHLCRKSKESRVELHGLKNKPQFNGCKGKLVDFGASTGDRWLVRLDSGTELKVKAENCNILEAGYGSVNPLNLGGTYLRSTFTAEGMICEERPVSEVRGLILSKCMPSSHLTITHHLSVIQIRERFKIFAGGKHDATRPLSVCNASTFLSTAMLLGGTGSHPSSEALLHLAMLFCYTGDVHMAVEYLQEYLNAWTSVTAKCFACMQAQYKPKSMPKCSACGVARCVLGVTGQRIPSDRATHP